MAKQVLAQSNFVYIDDDSLEVVWSTRTATASRAKCCLGRLLSLMLGPLVLFVMLEYRRAQLFLTVSLALTLQGRDRSDEKNDLLRRQGVGCFSGSKSLGVGRSTGPTRIEERRGGDSPPTFLRPFLKMGGPTMLLFNTRTRPHSLTKKSNALSCVSILVIWAIMTCRNKEAVNEVNSSLLLCVVSV